MTPRILLAEDDPVSREYLADTLRKLGCEVLAVADGNAADSAAFAQEFDLLLLDHRMPGLDGDRVLEIARANRYARNRDTPAIATTADPDPALHQRLRRAGFDGVLVKPLDAARLREGMRGTGIVLADEALDDTAGLAASGGSAALRDLRMLFARELDDLATAMESLRENPHAFPERLHRLRASCGFCGALLLQRATAALSDSLRKGDPAAIAECDAKFAQALAETREALRAGTT